jgi:hypothetical protein
MTEIPVEHGLAAIFTANRGVCRCCRRHLLGNANADFLAALKLFHSFTHLIALALVAAACLAWPSPAAAFSGAWSSQVGRDADLAGSSLLLRVRVVCSRERHGDVITTHFCADGHVCLSGGKCGPGAAMKREMERRLEALKAEMKRNQDEIERRRRAAEEAARRLAVPPQQPAARPSASQGGDPCSDITGTGGGSGPSNCTQSNGMPRNLPGQVSRSPSNSPAAPAPRHVVVVAPPQCNMCDVLKSVGEVLPDLAEKLDKIKPEAIGDVEPPLFDGGPNTLHPYLPRRPLTPVTESDDPLDTLEDIASNAKALKDFTEKNKEPEEYGEICQDGFLEASWKAFRAKDSSYGEKAKAARDSLKKCWKAAVKHIEDTITNGGADPNAASEDK